MDIQKVLEQAPAMIAKKESEAEDSRLIWKSAELNLEQMYSKMYLSEKAKDPDLTQNDLKAKVTESHEYYEKKMDCITMESAYKKACIEVTKWTNAFTSARKIANLRIEEMRNLDVTVRTRGGENGAVR